MRFIHSKNELVYVIPHNPKSHNDQCIKKLLLNYNNELLLAHTIRLSTDNEIRMSTSHHITIRLHTITSSEQLANNCSKDSLIWEHKGQSNESKSIPLSLRFKCIGILLLPIRQIRILSLIGTKKFHLV